MKEYASELPDFLDLLQAVAQGRNIPAAIVEKDYYLVRALRILEEAYGGQFLLKGGTSLSKGWALLDRFSEDLDLLLRVESGTGEISKGERERRMKGMCTTLSRSPGFSVMAGKYPAETGVHRTAELEYASVVEDIVGLSKTVRLEIGTRGGVHPSALRRVSSMVAEFAAAQSLGGLAEDLAPFDVEMLDVRRTFVEKLFTVHAAFLENRAANRTRHYYDLYRLCGLQEIQEFVGSEAYWEIFRSVKEHSQRHFPGVPVPDGESFSASEAFRPRPEDAKALERNYEREKYLFFKEPPAFSAILDAIQQLLSAL